MMKTVVRPYLKSTTVCSRKGYSRFREKEISSVDFKFYQKFFVVLVSLSTFLIFPESPRELQNICESFHTTESCNVW